VYRKEKKRKNVEESILYKWDTGGPPSQTIELQEMIVDGQGSGETTRSRV
jgi:hypothetical protein